MPRKPVQVAKHQMETGTLASASNPLVLVEHRRYGRVDGTVGVSLNVAIHRNDRTKTGIGRSRFAPLDFPDLGDARCEGELPLSWGL